MWALTPRHAWDDPTSWRWCVAIWDGYWRPDDHQRANWRPVGTRRAVFIQKQYMEVRSAISCSDIQKTIGGFGLFLVTAGPGNAWILRLTVLLTEADTLCDSGSGSAIRPGCLHAECCHNASMEPKQIRLKQSLCWNRCFFLPGCTVWRVHGACVPVYSLGLM